MLGEFFGQNPGSDITSRARIRQLTIILGVSTLSGTSAITVYTPGPRTGHLNLMESHLSSDGQTLRGNHSPPCHFG